MDIATFGIIVLIGVLLQLTRAMTYFTVKRLFTKYFTETIYTDHFVSVAPYAKDEQL